MEFLICKDCSNENLNVSWCQIDINSGVFDNVGRAFAGMFTLFTTENYPDIIFPAYHFNAAKKTSNFSLILKILEKKSIIQIERISGFSVVFVIFRFVPVLGNVFLQCCYYWSNY